MCECVCVLERATIEIISTDDGGCEDDGDIYVYGYEVGRHSFNMLNGGEVVVGCHI